MFRKVVYSLLLICAVLVFVFAAIVGKLSTSELATWVQSIGSIAAIWAAFTVGAQQSNAAIKVVEHEHRLNSASVRKGFGLLAEAVYRHATICERLFQGNGCDWGNFHHANVVRPLEGLLRALDEIPFAETGTSDGVQSLASLKADTTDLIALLKAAGDRLQTASHMDPPTSMDAPRIRDLSADVKRHAINLLRGWNREAVSALTGEAIPATA